ncbi:MAG: hypothetical protein HKM04_08345 [Legionellales bacterium]|nr:hypothetical protein [Legionellales bacterium]
MSPVLNHERHLEVFLVYDLGQKYSRLEIDGIFSLPMDLIFYNISKIPLFFDRDSLVHYMRFIDAQYCILKAYVPDSAIEGHFEGLFLKKNQLSMKQIHGCLIDCEKEAAYLLNPAFDEALLALVKPREEDL